MTNEEIIFNAKQNLLAEGKIKATGRMINVELPSGQVVTVTETEELHTFAAWKACGYSVKKGQKSVATIRIWKNTRKQVEITGPDPKTGEMVTVTEEASKMFMKDAYFFSASQVEPSRERKTA